MDISQLVSMVFQILPIEIFAIPIAIALFSSISKMIISNTDDHSGPLMPHSSIPAAPAEPVELVEWRGREPIQRRQERTVCHYCGAVFVRNKKGLCSACGAPRI